MAEMQAVVERRAVAFIDDDLKFIKVIRTWQSGVDMAERATADPDECLQWVRQRDVDGVVVDLNMPGRDGITVIEAIRRIDKRIAVYVLTGFDLSPEQLAALTQLHAKVFFKMRDLREFLNMLVKRSPGDNAEQMIELQEELEVLKGMHREWMKDLMSKLEGIPNMAEAIVHSSGEGFTVQQLIDDIRELRPRGIEHIRLWQDVLRTLRKKRKKK